MTTQIEQTLSSAPPPARRRGVIDFLNDLDERKLTLLLVVATLLLVIATCWLALESRFLAHDWRKTSSDQIGVQTWLYLQNRFDSSEMKSARKILAGQLNPYTRTNHDAISEEVMEFFETVGNLYRRKLINLELCDSSFSFYIVRYWAACKPYVDDERLRQGGDPSIYSDFQILAEEFGKRERAVDARMLNDFLSDETRKN